VPDDGFCQAPKPEARAQCFEIRTDRKDSVVTLEVTTHERPGLTEAHEKESPLSAESPQRPCSRATPGPEVPTSDSRGWKWKHPIDLDPDEDSNTTVSTQDQHRPLESMKIKLPTGDMKDDSSCETRSDDMKSQHSFRTAKYSDTDSCGTVLGNKVMVGLGRTQIVQMENTGPDCTVIAHHVWQEHVRQEANQGRPNKYWEKYKRLNGNERKSFKGTMCVDGIDLETVGPFLARIHVGPIPIITRIFVTPDSRFKRRLIIGQDVWNPLPVKVIATSRVTNRSTVTVSSQLNPFDQVNTLIDTGAGPNVITTNVLKTLGGDVDNLAPMPFTMTAANEGAMETKGYAKGVSFSLAGKHMDVDAAVVESLGSHGFILGREFLIKYDVLVDIPRQTITIRNKGNRYRIKERLFDAPDTMQSFIARSQKKTDMTPGEINERTFLVQPRRSGNPLQGSLDEWLAIIDRNRNLNIAKQGFCAPNAVLRVNGDHTKIPLIDLVANPKKPRTLVPEKSEVVIRPLLIAYHREYYETDEHMPEEDLDNVSIRLDKDGSVNLITVNKPDSLRSSLRSTDTSEPPVVLPDMTRTEFPTKPDLKRAKEFLDDSEMKELNEVLSEYDDLFIEHKADLGKTDMLEHVIELYPDTQSFRDKVRRTTPDKNKACDDLVDEMLRMGIAEASCSSFASGVVLVKKKDGSYRFCVDYRRLNSLTKKETFTLPEIDDTIEKLGSARIFSSFDMGNAFWQIPLEEQSREYSAFITARGLWQYTRMPYGLCNAASTFQRLMSKVLWNVTQHYGNIILCYIDDILVATNTIGEHLERIREIFACLRKAGLKLKASKCTMFDKEITFLGRRIKDGNITPDPKRIEAVREWTEPRHVEDLRHYLGFTNYYREFLKGYAEIVEPMAKLLRKRAPWDWCEEQSESFDTIKEMIMREPTLRMPVKDGKYVLDTDAGNVAIAGILHQWQESETGEDKLYVIAYGSKSLNSHERNYGAPKLEMFAALKFMEKFKNYLGNSMFVLRVDNKALEWLRQYKIEENPHAARWVTRMQSFLFEIEHRVRTKHKAVDGLGKRPIDFERRDVILAENTKEDKVATLTFLGPETKKFLEDLSETSRKDKSEVLVAQETYLIRQRNVYDILDIQEAQTHDGDLAAMMAAIRDPPSLTNHSAWGKVANKMTKVAKRWWKRHYNNLRLNSQDVLVLLPAPDTELIRAKLVVPGRFRDACLKAAHDDLEHQDERRSYARLHSVFDWPGMRRSVDAYVAKCMRCQLARPAIRKRQAKLTPIETRKINELVHIDYLTIRESDDGYHGVLMAIDHYSKYCIVVPVKRYTALNAAFAMWDRWVSIHGIPEIIQSDQGAEFESTLFNQLMTALGVRRMHSTIYQSQVNEMMERQSLTILQLLKMITSKHHRDWPDHIQKAPMVYNASVHDLTHQTPNMLMLGREINIPISMLFPGFITKYEEETLDVALRKRVLDVAKYYSYMRQDLQKTQKRLKKSRDRHSVKVDKFAVGQWVMIYLEATKKGDPNPAKEFRFHGPFQVVGTLKHGGQYQLENGKTVHAERVRPFVADMFEFPTNDDYSYIWDGAHEQITRLEPGVGKTDMDEGSHASSNTTLRPPSQCVEYNLRKRNSVRRNYEEKGTESTDSDDLNPNYIAPEDDSPQLQQSTEHEEESFLVIRTAKPWDGEIPARIVPKCNIYTQFDLEEVFLTLTTAPDPEDATDKQHIKDKENERTDEEHQQITPGHHLSDVVRRLRHLARINGSTFDADQAVSDTSSEASCQYAFAQMYPLVEHVDEDLRSERKRYEKKHNSYARSVVSFLKFCDERQTEHNAKQSASADHSTEAPAVDRHVKFQSLSRGLDQNKRGEKGSVNLKDNRKFSKISLTSDLNNIPEVSGSFTRAWLSGVERGSSSIDPIQLEAPDNSQEGGVPNIGQEGGANCEKQDEVESNGRKTPSPTRELSVCDSGVLFPGDGVFSDQHQSLGEHVGFSLMLENRPNIIGGQTVHEKTSCNDPRPIFGLTGMQIVADIPTRGITLNEQLRRFFVEFPSICDHLMIHEPRNMGEIIQFDLSNSRAIYLITCHDQKGMHFDVYYKAMVEVAALCKARRAEHVAALCPPTGAKDTWESKARQMFKCFRGSSTKRVYVIHLL
jgi:transposase InsO family protein